MEYIVMLPLDCISVIEKMEDIGLVSIIMPAYNAAKYISASIESVLAQTYQQFELIIIDDGSTDNTKNIVEDYSKKDSRIRYVHQSNAGVSAARNNGLSVATGQYLACLDSDDLWPLDKLQLQISCFDGAENLIVLGNVERFVTLPNGDLQKGTKTILADVSADKEKYVQQVLALPSNYMVHFNTCLGKIEIFRDGGGWDENLINAEDWDFWLRLACTVKFVHIDNIVLHYRKHLNSATASVNSKYWISLNSQILALEKYKKFKKIGWFEFRNLKIKLYSEVIGNLTYTENYIEAMSVYWQAILHSNIFLKKAAISFVAEIFKGLLTQLVRVFR